MHLLMIQVVQRGRADDWHFERGILHSEWVASDPHPHCITEFTVWILMFVIDLPFCSGESLLFLQE